MMETIWEDVLRKLVENPLGSWWNFWYGQLGILFVGFMVLMPIAMIYIRTRDPGLTAVTAILTLGFAGTAASGQLIWVLEAIAASTAAYVLYKLLWKE